MKYPCTAEMYAAFLNACANRHDGSADDNHDFYSSTAMTGNQYCRLSKTSGAEGTDAVFAAVSGYEDYAVTRATWWNAYDWCKWAGLRMPTEAEFEYEASYMGARDFPWDDIEPNTTSNIRCNMYGVSPANASDVRSYDGYGGGKDGLSAHSAAEMSGNVEEWEFTKAYWSSSYVGAYSAEAETGYGSSSDRVSRGGLWNDAAVWLRAGSRNFLAPSYRLPGGGFRAAK
ncbi:MAG: SUMF1/EgtB/PvdO family nonheme iron enzyme [Candidatus Latescibacterota bacterium]